MNEFSSSNTLEALFFLLPRATADPSVAQAMSHWKMRGGARTGCAAQLKRGADQRVRRISARCTRRLVHCGKRNCRARRAKPRVLYSAWRWQENSGSRTMDLFTVVIIATVLATVVTMFLGVLTMSGGGSTDKDLSTPLMWARVGFQALTLVLLFVAIRLR